MCHPNLPPPFHFKLFLDVEYTWYESHIKLIAYWLCTSGDRDMMLPEAVRPRALTVSEQVVDSVI